METSLHALPLSRIRHVLAALFFGTAVCLGMIAIRFWYAQSGRFGYLIWNLILAWIPLGLSFLVRRIGTTGGWQNVFFWGGSVLWLLFFPNTFYLVTDLIHADKFGRDDVPFWYDTMTTAGFACGGMFLGCLSLYLMHLFVRERLGFRLGWLFAVTMLALASFGIYLGRYPRLNSWEFIRPLRLVRKVVGVLDSPAHVVAYCTTMFFFSLMVYWFVVAVARMHEDEV